MQALFAHLIGIVVLTISAGGWSASSLGDGRIDLKWRDLIPIEERVVPKARRSPFDLGRLGKNGDGTDTLAARKAVPEGKWMSRPSRAQGNREVKVVDALDGKQVRIGGYVVPLDFDAKAVKDFLLVPFVGACVHVPPPPANQIIYVRIDKGLKLDGLFDPVYVEGRLRTKMTFTGLAQTGYVLDAVKAEKRVVQ